MTRMRKYRTVVFINPPNLVLGNIELKPNERIVRETAFYDEDQMIRCIVLIRETIKTEPETIRIEISEGIVQDVKGLPKGYQYEIIECDKYGEPLPPEDDQ